METLTGNNEKNIFDTFLHYLAIWFRYKWLVIILTSLVTGAVVAFSIVSVVLPPEESPMPSYYTAQGTIIVQQDAQSGLSSSILSALGIASSGIPMGFDYGAQIMEILRSRVILDKLIDEYDLTTKFGGAPRETIRELLLYRYQFYYSQTTGMMRITYVDINPELASNMVNRMISLLGEWYVQSNNQSRQKQQDLLEEKITTVKQDINLLRNRLKTLPDIDPRYAEYTSELDVQQRIYDALFPQYEASRLAPESEPVFQVFETAEVPQIKTGPSRKKYVVMALFGSFAASSGLAFLIDILGSFFRKRAYRK